MTAGARNRCKARSKRRNALTLWFTPYCLPTTTGIVAALASRGGGEWAGAGGGFRGGGGPGGGVAAAIRRNLTWTARKFWIRFPKKPVADSTKFLKSRRSIKFTTASPRN